MAEPVDDFLAHYGVKGMKWGERRAALKAERIANRDSAREKGYTDRMRREDIRDMGIRGTRRVEKRVAGGEKINNARFKEFARTKAQGAAFVASLIGGAVAINAASKGLSTLANNINTKRGAAAAATMLADSRGLTSYNTLGMAFNAATGTWR